MKFSDANLKLEKYFYDENAINIEVSYYDESLDCYNETTIVFVKEDIVQMAKKLGIITIDL